MRNLVEPANKDVSIAKQCELLDISSSTYYSKPIKPKDEDCEVMELIEKIYLKFPCYGSRRMAKALQKQGKHVGRKRAKRLMRLMGIEAIYQRPNTSKPCPEHKIYPYLLKGLEIKKPNQVWCTDITYIRLNTGWAYLIAVMDWHSRRVISWELSNTMDLDFCCRVLKKALQSGTPEIFNTDQGAQFTSPKFVNILKKKQIKVSMDGRGRYLDNILIERLWRTVKYEDVFINDYETLKDARKGLMKFFLKYNMERLHQALGYQTPNEIWTMVS